MANFNQDRYNESGNPICWDAFVPLTAKQLRELTPEQGIAYMREERAANRACRAETGYDINEQPVYVRPACGCPEEIKGVSCCRCDLRRFKLHEALKKIGFKETKTYAHQTTITKNGRSKAHVERIPIGDLTPHVIAAITLWETTRGPIDVTLPSVADELAEAYIAHLYEA